MAISVRVESPNRQRVFKNTLLIFLPLFLCSSSVMAILCYFNLEKNKILVQTHAVDSSNMLKNIILQDLEAFTSDLLSSANHSALKEILEKKALDTLIKDYSLLLKIKKTYDEIRFVNAQGIEQLHIDYNDGNPISAPLAKAKCFCFEEAITLNTGEFYISPLENHGQNREMKYSLQPIICAGTPVFDEKNKKIGVIILSYLSEKLLHHFELATPSDVGHIMLLNAQGYWLKGFTLKSRWDAMFGEQKEFIFQNFFPEEWKQISKSDSGHFTNDAGLFTFVTIHLKNNFNSEEYWKIVSYIPNHQLFTNTVSFLRTLAVIYFPLVFFIGIGSLLFSFLWDKRISAEQFFKKLHVSYTRFVPEEFLRLLNKHSFVDIYLADRLQREITVLFSDIRSFTKLSESMTPEENFNFLCDYFKRIYPAIQNNAGFIDKFIGDGVMAVFPETPEDALHAAIEMQQQVNLLNKEREIQGHSPIRAGIGFHYGEVILGTVGCEDRMNTTVIGDAVNLASRLEALTKVFKVDIIFSSGVYKKLPNPQKFHLREIDAVRVKGKQEVIILYEAFDADLPSVLQKKKEILSDFQRAVDCYRVGNFDEAIKLFTLCHDHCPEDSIPPIYLKRCHTLLRVPPDTEWAGVSTL